jgi:hypothetical protein
MEQRIPVAALSSFACAPPSHTYAFSLYAHLSRVTLKNSNVGSIKTTAIKYPSFVKSTDITSAHRKEKNKIKN